MASTSRSSPRRAPSTFRSSRQMAAIQKIEGETRVAKADVVSETEESVFEIVRQMDETNQCLDDLNETLKMAIDKKELYNIKAQRARKLMRRLTSEL